MRTREEATGSLSNLWTSHVHGPEGSDEPSQPRIAAWIEKDEEEEEGEECVLPSASSSSPLGDGRRFASPQSQAQDAFALHRSRQEQEAL